MRLVLVGADCEENLGMCMISASAAAHGHKVQVVAFDQLSQRDEVARCVLDSRAGCVGLAAQFQHRGAEFLSLAARLRKAGYRGHITCGGQFPTMAYREVLEGGFGVDSVVLHEGDHTLGDLLDALQSGAPLHTVPGLAYVDSQRKARRSAVRPLIADLDSLPIARRYRAHSRHFGIPFIPIWGSRGCWGNCTYCSISTCYRDARAQAGGRTLRLRSPQNLATEMAVLWHAAGGSAIFCFHDETFLLPRPADTLARLTELRKWLDEYGVGKAALVGKCRPESLTPELAKQLRELGLVRLYVGIENASQSSADHLNRKTKSEALPAALRACQSAGIFPCYNLLLFEPLATLEDVEKNIAFMREHATVPVNFCRAEPYHGTPLCESLRQQGALGGSFLGWDYRIQEDRTELLFRICSAVFRERNFDAKGVTNRSMGLGYAARVLEFFHQDRAGEGAQLMRRATDLTRSMTLEKCDLLEEALELAKRADLADRDRIERETVLLGLRVASSNRLWHKALDDILGAMSDFASRSAEKPVRRSHNRSLRQAVQTLQAVAMVGSLSVAVTACSGKTETKTEQLVGDAGKDSSDASKEIGPYDALPFDSGTDLQTYDPLPPDAGAEAADVEVDMQTYDPLPPDASEVGPYDALPFDAASEDETTVDDPLPADAGLDLDLLQDDSSQGGIPEQKLAVNPSVVERWVDTSPRRASRSADLPLFQPPVISLRAARQGDQIQVTLFGSKEPMSLRWHALGRVEGEGESVAWTPASDDDQIHVAVRTRGGVAIASLRLAEVDTQVS